MPRCGRYQILHPQPPTHGGGTLPAERSRSETLPRTFAREFQNPPLQRTRTAFSRLDVLQEAYTAVTNDASQMQMEDLVQATRLVHQIGTVLNEYMGRRFDAMAATLRSETRE